MEQPKTNRRRPVRWCLRQARRLVVWTGVLLVFAVIGFTIYAWSVNTRGRHAARQVADQLEERGLLGLYPAHLESGEGPYTDETGTSAAYWRAAMDAAPDAGELPLPAVAVVSTEPAGPKQRYHPDVVAAMRQAVDDNGLFYGLVQAARDAEPGRFTPRDPVDRRMGNLDTLGGSRRIARWMQVRAALAEADNDGAGFTDAMLAITDLNNNLRDDPQVIAALVRISIDALMREAVIEGLSRIELSPEQLGRLILALEDRTAEYDVQSFLGLALSSEYHRVTADVQSFIGFMEARQAIALHEYRESMETLFDLPEEKSVAGRLWDNTMLAWCPGRYTLRHAEQMKRTIKAYDDIAALQANQTQRWSLVNSLAEQERDEDVSAFETRSMHVYLATAAKTMLQADCRMRAAIAALQVERYRVEHGAWPQKLEDATGQTSIDARSDAIRYRPSADGVVIYAIGDNGVDEQGYSQYDDNVPSQFVDPDDYPVRLYNPELRNALPPPAHAITPEPDYDGFLDFDEPGDPEE